jgi:MFS family permease
VRIPVRAPRPNLHAAVAALFALDGVVFGSWAARVPDVSAHVGATASTLGVALLCVSLGALATMHLTGALCARLGAGTVAFVAALAVCVTLVLPGLVTTVPQLCAVLLAFGAATGAVNVAANSVGIRVEGDLGRPVMSLLHAGFSLGGLAGALLGGLASGVPTTWHLLAVAVAGLLATAVFGPALTGADRSPRDDEDHGPHHSVVDDPPEVERDATGGRRGTGSSVIVLLGAVAGCTAFVEGAVTDWGALGLRETLHVSTSVAAAGYAAFSGAMALGRLAGRRLILRLGDVVLVAGGGLAAAAGLLTATLTSSLPVALLGYVLVGLGLANVFPLALARAGLLAGPRGVALASFVGYGGLLAGPPVIGVLAGLLGVSSALAGVSVLAVAAAGLAVTVDARLEGTASVAAALRTQARARLEPATARVKVKVRSAAWQHADDLRVLVNPGGPAVRAYPGLEFLVG